MTTLYGEKNPFYGKKHTKESLEKMSKVHKGKHRSLKTEFKKGHKLNLGRKFSDEHRKKLSEAKEGVKQSEEHRRKIGEAKMGHIVSEETRIKIGNAHRNKIVSKETREKLRKALKGKKLTKEHIENRTKSRAGYRHSEETRKKISESNKGNTENKLRGENHPNWVGGTSFEPYSLDWTETLRRSIRERDNYTCQLCSKQQGDKAFHIHHIDYNKKNCNPNNLITLCRSCHPKTNFKRKYWEDYFNKLLLNNYV